MAIFTYDVQYITDKPVDRFRKGIIVDTKNQACDNKSNVIGYIHTYNPSCSN
ncbi:hypothetical protein [Paenibacillus mendelii]|uniref:Uncharacterized protein n=1 Tax=Paenibacillus mendelii TaxID=206163 RepID=A0ABV6JKS9_9BACL|nr:hypothetical protein [Paenibacillus mendelii]MCQ6560637.1 hypothetical protein [Paenibacillus mendelii]